MFHKWLPLLSWHISDIFLMNWFYLISCVGKKKKKYCLYAGIDFRSINAQTRRIDYVTSLSQNESLKIQFLKMSN